LPPVGLQASGVRWLAPPEVFSTSGCRHFTTSGTTKIREPDSHPGHKNVRRRRYVTRAFAGSTPLVSKVPCRGMAS
jgi:hypothetical protein